MTAHQPRSRNWFGRSDLDGFVHRSWPVIGIANSWSGLTNCNAHLRQVAEAVKRGGWSAGGFPLEFQTISLGEVLMKPTTMLCRNLMAMDVDECIRAYPPTPRSCGFCSDLRGGPAPDIRTGPSGDGLNGRRTAGGHRDQCVRRGWRQPRRAGHSSTRD